MSGYDASGDGWRDASESRPAEPEAVVVDSDVVYVGGGGSYGILPEPTLAAMKVAVSTITCRGCGRVLSQSIPRFADLGNEDPDDDEVEHEAPCNYAFAQVDPCPDHPHGVPVGPPLLWTVRLLEVPETDGQWLLEKYGTPQAVYNVGYEEGGSSREADWQFALNEHAKLPDDVEIDPMQIAAYITRLQGEAAELRASHPLLHSGAIEVDLSEHYLEDDES